MFRKVMFSIALFLILFTAAWWANETKVPKTQIISPEQDGVQILEQGTREGFMQQNVRYFHEPFQPREYIRIYKREGNEELIQ